MARAQRLGWQVTEVGTFKTPRGEVDILSIPWEEVLIRVRWSWMDVVSDEVLHRSSLDGLHKSDLYEVTRQLSMFFQED